jgi:hypothetical protein
MNSDDLESIHKKIRVEDNSQISPATSIATSTIQQFDKKFAMYSDDEDLHKLDEARKTDPGQILEVIREHSPSEEEQNRQLLTPPNTITGKRLCPFQSTSPQESSAIEEETYLTKMKGSMHRFLESYNHSAKLSSGEKTTLKRIRPNGLENFDGLKAIYHLTQKGHSQNSSFVNRAAHLIHFIKNFSPSAATLFHELVEKQKDPDLKAYIDYLESGETTFAISRVKNPKFDHIKTYISSYSIFRLEAVKHRLAHVLLTLCKSLCNLRKYSNKIKFHANDEKVSGREWTFSSPQFQSNNPKISEESAKRFFLAHKVSQKTLKSPDGTLEEVRTSVASEASLFDVSHLQPESFCFSPLREFCIPTLTDADTSRMPFFVRANAAHAVLMGPGVHSFTPAFSNKTIEKEASSFSDMKDFYSCETSAIIQKIKIQFYYDTKTPSNTQEQILGQIDYGLSSKNFTIVDSLKRENCFMISRNSKLQSHASSEIDFAQKFEHNANFNEYALDIFFEKYPLLFIEPVLAFKNLRIDDVWSLYLKWEALEASPHILGVYSLASSISAIASQGYRWEVQKLASKSLNGDNIAKKVLKCYFPDGKINGDLLDSA